VLPVTVRDKHGALVASSNQGLHLTETAARRHQELYRETDLPSGGPVVDPARVSGHGERAQAAGEFVDAICRTPSQGRLRTDQAFLNFDREVELLRDFTPRATAAPRAGRDGPTRARRRNARTDSSGRKRKQAGRNAALYAIFSPP